jgi:dihydrofolate reductase
VFVLTHYPREPLVMKGGTTFHFVTDGIHAALERAREAVGDGDIGISGGAATANDYLAAGLVDELVLHVSPFTIGARERLFEGVRDLKLEPLSSRTTGLVTHINYRVLH